MVPFLFNACQEDEIPSQIRETEISKVINEQVQNLPFESVSVLKEFDSYPEILDYALARKIAWVELASTEMDKAMSWEGNKLSSTPIVVYGFDNKPKFYDFIVLDAEGNAVGTLTVYARRSASTSIRAISSEIKDYSASLSKAGNDASLFVDWAGSSYVGIRGKADGSPTSIINAETGEIAEGIKEIEGKQIIEEMKAILPTLLAFDNSPASLRSSSADDEEQKKYDDLLNALKNQSTDALIDSMLVALLQDQNQTEAYWNFMTEFIPEIEQLDDEEIISDSGKGLFSRIVSAIRRVFSGVDETKYYLDRYAQRNKSYNPTTSGSVWCGPWVCGYIWYIKSGQDKYSSFESYASTVGELGILNFALRLLGRPMTPAEMAWSMPIVSGGKIRIDPDLRFVDYAAYDQIRYNKKPALRLCAKNSSLHWTVAYGAYQTGSYLWRTYYYLQHDNGSLFSRGGYKDPSVNSNYSQVDWWNPWLLVWD
jgi:hypothetical protein